jgi:hypothetical protein
MPGQWDFANVLGDAFRRVIQWNDENGNPINLTGCSATMIIRANRSANAAVYGTLTTGNSGIVIADPPNGSSSLAWTSAQQAALNFRTAAYDLTFTFPNGDVVTLLSGEYNAFDGAIEGGGTTSGVTVSGTGEITVVTVGYQGPPGTGTGGGSETAGTSISADTAVVLIGGLLYPANPTNLAHAGKVIGVASQSGLVGATINYQFAGEVAGGSWTQDSFYFVGLNGVLSTTPNASGAVWSQLIGYAKSSSVLVVNTGQPVAL